MKLSHLERTVIREVLMFWVIEDDKWGIKSIYLQDVESVRPIRKPVPPADAPDGDDGVEDGDVLEDLDAPEDNDDRAGVLKVALPRLRGVILRSDARHVNTA